MKEKKGKKVDEGKNGDEGKKKRKRGEEVSVLMEV